MIFIHLVLVIKNIERGFYQGVSNRAGELESEYEFAVKSELLFFTIRLPNYAMTFQMFNFL